MVLPIKKRQPKIYEKHGMTKTKAYWRWAAMLDRCRNKANPCWGRYGGRGISVCKRWQQFSNFYFDMGEQPGPRMSIDRINNDGNYEPKNCRWATLQVQRDNSAYKRKDPRIATIAIKIDRSLRERFKKTARTHGKSQTFVGAQLLERWIRRDIKLPGDNDFRSKGAKL